MPAVAAGLLGAGASIYAGSQASKAAKKTAKLQQETTNRVIDLQQQNLQQIRSDAQPFLQTGYSGLDALLAQLGLGSSQGGGADYNAYLQQNPDVLAWAQAGGGDPSKPIEQQSLAERAAYHYANSGRAEGRQLPTTPVTGPAPTGTPQVGSRPTQVTLPAMPDLGPGSYQKSPGYEYQQKEGIRNLNANFGARGLLKSGAAIKGVQTFSQNLADQDYQQWQQNELAKWKSNFDAAVAQNNLLNQTFENDRNYATNVFNTRTGNLQSLVGVGQNALGTVTNANTNFANNVGNQLQTNSNVLADSAAQRANANASTWNNIAGIGQNLLTGWGGGGQREMTPIPTTQAYAPLQAASPYIPNNLLRAPSPVF